MIVLGAADTLSAQAGAATSVTVTIHGLEVATGTETFKRLYQGQPGNTATTLYAVPASTQALIRTILVANMSGSSQSIKFWAAGTADANVILPAITLATGEYAVYDQGGWMFFTSLGEQKGKGTIGATGAVGVTGATGAAGVTGVTGATGPAITIANTEAADVTGSGIIRTGTAGENVSFGDVVYMKSDGKLWKADANAAGLFPAMAMALGTITANNSGSFLLRGQARNDAWNWTVGGIVYLSTTAGSMTQTQPAATDDCIQVLGVAFPNADTVNFNPSPDYITHT